MAGLQKWKPINERIEGALSTLKKHNRVQKTYPNDYIDVNVCGDGQLKVKIHCESTGEKASIKMSYPMDARELARALEECADIMEKEMKNDTR